MVRFWVQGSRFKGCNILTSPTFKFDVCKGHFHPLGEIAFLSFRIYNPFSMRWLVLQRHFIAKHLKFNLNYIRIVFALSFPRKRESSLFSDIIGVLDARFRGHDVKK